MYSEAAAPFICIRELLGSNLDRDTVYFDWIPLCSLLSVGECLGTALSHATFSSLHIHSISSYTVLIIRHYKVQFIDN